MIHKSKKIHQIIDIFENWQKLLSNKECNFKFIEDYRIFKLEKTLKKNLDRYIFFVLRKISQNQYHKQAYFLSGHLISQDIELSDKNKEIIKDEKISEFGQFP